MSTHGQQQVGDLKVSNSYLTKRDKNEVVIVCLMSTYYILVTRCK